MGRKMRKKAVIPPPPGRMNQSRENDERLAAGVCFTGQVKLPHPIMLLHPIPAPTLPEAKATAGWHLVKKPTALL